MSYDILIAKMSFSMTEGVLAEWHAADGDQIKEGEPLYSIEADKSTVEVPSPASGTLKIIAVPGESYEVGTIIGSIE